MHKKGGIVKGMEREETKGLLRPGEEGLVELGRGAEAAKWTEYKVEEKAEAIALAEMYGYRPAARVMKKRHPEMEHIDHRLIAYWHRKVAPEGYLALKEGRLEAFESGLIDLGLKATGVLYEELDKEGSDRKIAAGIAIDKPLALIRAKAAAKVVEQGGPQVVVQTLIQLDGKRAEVAVTREVRGVQVEAGEDGE